MDVLIKGMDMPRSCYECDLFRLNCPAEEECHCALLGPVGTRWEVSKRGERDDDCPLVPYPTPHGKRTNADKIRALTDENLADELLTAFAAFYEVEWSKDAVLDWLKQEAQDG